MKFDNKLLQEIAKNSRLNLTELEQKEFLPQLQEIMKVFTQLDEVNVDKIKPSFHPIKLENVSRKDKVEECFNEDQVFSKVKNKEDGFFKGPKAI